jgi:hypothetical protein
VFTYEAAANGINAGAGAASSDLPPDDHRLPECVEKVEPESARRIHGDSVTVLAVRMWSPT